ncbi:MAG: dolichol kinase [bacterium]
MKAIDRGTIDFKFEILRKSIHLCSLSIPILYYYITRETALTIFVPLTIFALVIDIARYFSPPIKKIVHTLFGFLLRQHEVDEKKKNLSGATYVLISATLGILLIPKLYFITAFAILILGDISAALFGRKFGKHQFLYKSLEGTLAFFIVSSIVIFFTPKADGLFIEYAIGVFAAAVGAIAENISYGWADDNLTVPFSVGLTMWLLYYIFLPHIEFALRTIPM